MMNFDLYVNLIVVEMSVFNIFILFFDKWKIMFLLCYGINIFCSL